MKVYKIIYINLSIVFSVIILGSCSVNKSKSIEEPKHVLNNQYVKHYAYTLQYNEETEQAQWVSYKLGSIELAPNFKRTNRFLKDTLVSTSTAENKDYVSSGYDRGHLAPAADMAWSEQAMKESFYYSNICPQLPGFNRGIWKKLETKVRSLAIKYDNVYVVTGPIFKNEKHKIIGKNNVMIPSHFYKALLIYNDSIKQSIAFLFPHERSKTDLFNYAISVDSLEQVTELDFFTNLPNNKENKIEKAFDLIYWRK